MFDDVCWLAQFFPHVSPGSWGTRMTGGCSLFFSRRREGTLEVPTFVAAEDQSAVSQATLHTWTMHAFFRTNRESKCMVDHGFFHWGGGRRWFILVFPFELGVNTHLQTILMWNLGCQGPFRTWEPSLFPIEVLKTHWTTVVPLAKNQLSWLLEGTLETASLKRM